VDQVRRIEPAQGLGAEGLHGGDYSTRRDVAKIGVDREPRNRRASGTDFLRRRRFVATRVSALRAPTGEDHEQRRARVYDRVLLDLSMRNGASGGRLGDICVAASSALGVERVGVWLFDSDHGAIRSVAGYERTGERFLPPAELRAADFPAYFAALESQRVIAADDAHRDSRTREFSASYLTPFGITSMLDAPIRLHGKLLGTICCEHVGPPRAWVREDERFAASLGDLVALALAADERAAADEALSAYEARHRAFEALLGRPVAESVGEHFGTVVYPEDHAQALDLFARAVAGEALAPFELRLVRRDGEPVWIEFTIRSTDELGRTRSVFGIGRDVTARKRAELRRRALVEIAHELARAQDDLGQALHGVHDHLAWALPCGLVATLLADPASGDLTTIAGRGVDAIGAAGPAFPPLELAQRAIVRGETIAVRGGSGADTDGGPRRARSLVASVLRSADGVLGALVVGRDEPGGFDAEQIELCDSVARELVIALVAARRRREEQAEAEVAAALARVGQELISSVDLPVLLDALCRVTAEVLDCDVGHTLLWDPVSETFSPTASFGNTPEQWERLRHLRIPIGSRSVLEILRTSEVIVARRGDGMLPDRVWQMYETRLAVIIALRRGDRIVGALTAARRRDTDVGPHRVRIARGIGQLASLALANARLVAELESASRLKSDFVATISHELRTPLNVILGYNELLLVEEFGRVSPEQADTLRRIRSSATELMQLIDATLDLSRLEAGRETLQLADVDLETLLCEVWAETAAIRERKPHLSFSCEVAASGVVHSDALKLKVVLKNLFSNAVKFTHDGAVAVSAALRGRSVEIAVRDTGIGIGAETRAVIFEPFRQGDGSMTRRYGGVGLGLYIVSRILDALGGRIEVESELGRGTVFRVEVPADGRDAPATRRRSATPYTSGT
jgi:PAS domain S-box-containing protein